MDAENLFVMPDSIFKSGQGLTVFEVADVVTDESVTFADETKGVFELRPAGKRGQGSGRDTNGKRRVTAGSPLDVRHAVYHRDDRIVDAGMDRAVVEQESIRQLREARMGVLVGVGDGLLAEIAAGHNEYLREGFRRLQKEEVQRGIRQHKTQAVLVRSDQPGEFLARGRGFEQDYRRHRGVEQSLLLRADAGVKPDAFHIKSHQREGFAAAALAQAQFFDSLRVFGITDQVEAPQAFYRQDFAFSEGVPGGLDGIFTFRQPLSIFLVPNLRTANWAGNWLGMEAAVSGVLVFSRAVRAERKISHGGIGAVVGDASHDGKARTAIGAVDKGVAETAVCRVKKLPSTIRTDIQIRRDRKEVGGVIFAVVDVKAFKVFRGSIFDCEAVNDRERRRVLTQFRDESLQVVFFAAQFNFNAVGAVEHPTG